MKVEVWSDFVCPFCYIGERRLEAAIEKLSLQGAVEVEFKSFELDPNHPAYSGMSIHEALASKYGMSVEQAKAANRQIGLQAKEVGLNFDFERMKIANTRNAHRMAKLAKALGREKALIENMFAAYFIEGANLGDKETLLRIAESSGIDAHEAERVFDDTDAYLNDVRKDEAAARQYGVTSVPYFVIDRKYSISGAQPIETFVGALQRAWSEATPHNSL